MNFQLKIKNQTGLVILQWFGWIIFVGIISSCADPTMKFEVNSSLETGGCTFGNVTLKDGDTVFGYKDYLSQDCGNTTPNTGNKVQLACTKGKIMPEGQEGLYPFCLRPTCESDTGTANTLRLISQPSQWDDPRPYLEGKWRIDLTGDLGGITTQCRYVPPSPPLEWKTQDEYLRAKTSCACDTPNCIYQVSNTNITVPSDSPNKSGTFVLTANSQSCAWTSENNLDWITLNPTRGQGTQSIAYTYQTFTSPTSRSGSITIAGKQVTFTQNPPETNVPVCNLVASSSTPVDPGTTVTLTANCTNNPANFKWTGAGCTNISEKSCSPQPTQDTDYSVVASNNKGDSLPKAIRIQVTACSFVAPTSPAQIPYEGISNSTFWLQTSTGCSWTANASDSSWITVQPPNGTGSSSITYTVKASTSDRNGSITLGQPSGKTIFNINQKNSNSIGTPNCKIAAFPNLNIVVGDEVNLSANCDPAPTEYKWTSSNGSAVVCTNDSSNTGPACTVKPSSTTTYTLAGKNAGGTGTATATVSVSPCSFSLDPGSNVLGSGAAPSSFNVTPNGSKCPWQPNSDKPDWLKITDPTASTLGNKTVNFSLTANDSPTEDRIGHIKIGPASGSPSVTFTLTQNKRSANPPTCTLSANPLTIKNGQSTTLALSCNPAATSVTWSGGQCPTIGNMQGCTDNPSATTTYQIVGKNNDGQDTKTVTVNVEPCTYGSPENIALPASASSKAFAIPADSGCSWTARTGQATSPVIDGLTITSPTTAHPATGTTTVNFSWNENSDTQNKKHGKIEILNPSGQVVNTLTLEQTEKGTTAPVCSVAVSSVPDNPSGKYKTGKPITFTSDCDRTPTYSWAGLCTGTASSCTTSNLATAGSFSVTLTATKDGKSTTVPKGVVVFHRLTAEASEFGSIVGNDAESSGYGVVANQQANFDFTTNDIVLSLKAQPTTGSTFINWTEGGCENSNGKIAICTVKINNTKKIRANFSQKPVCTLEASNVRSCDTSSTTPVCFINSDQTPTLSTNCSPAVDTHTWSSNPTNPTGSCSNNSYTCSPTLTTATIFTYKGTKRFSPSGNDATSEEKSLAISVRQKMQIKFTGDGDGEVLLPDNSPNPPKCTRKPNGDPDGTGGICSEFFDNGLPVDLTPRNTSTASTFVGWTGCDSTPGTSCHLNNVNTPRTVTANFAKKPTCTLGLSSPNITQGATATVTATCSNSSTTIVWSSSSSTYASVSNCSGTTCQITPTRRGQYTITATPKVGNITGDASTAEINVSSKLTVVFEGSGKGRVSNNHDSQVFEFPSVTASEQSLLFSAADAATVSLTAFPDNYSVPFGWSEKQTGNFSQKCAPGATQCIFDTTASRTVRVTIEPKVAPRYSPRCGEKFKLTLPDSSAPIKVRYFQTGSAAKMVQSLYCRLFFRDPSETETIGSDVMKKDISGQAFWTYLILPHEKITGPIKDGIPDQVAADKLALLQSIVNSAANSTGDEMAADRLNVNNIDNLVTGAYRYLGMTPPDTNGYNYWTNRIPSNRPSPAFDPVKPGDYVYQIIKSAISNPTTASDGFRDHWLKCINGTGRCTDGRPDQSQLFIEDIYKSFFNRSGLYKTDGSPSDDGGVGYWASRLHAQMTLTSASVDIRPKAELIKAMLNSGTEFSDLKVVVRENNGTQSIKTVFWLTPENFIIFLYQMGFRRSPEDSGYAFWLAEWRTFLSGRLIQTVATPDIVNFLTNFLKSQAPNGGYEFCQSQQGSQTAYCNYNYSSANPDAGLRSDMLN